MYLLNDLSIYLIINSLSIKLKFSYLFKHLIKQLFTYSHIFEYQFVCLFLALNTFHI